MDAAMLSYSCPFEEQRFPFSSLKWVNNWCCYKSIQQQCYAMQIICLFSFLKQITYETNYFWGNSILTKSNFLLTDVYVTNCYFHIFFCHFILKCTFCKPIVFIVLWKSYQKISRGYLQYISFYLKNNIFVFFQMSALRTIFLTMSISIFIKYTQTNF